jgi:phenylacetate-CoA ligase
MLASHQLARFNRLLAEILPQNRFYAEKLGDLQGGLGSLEELAALPFTTKDDLLAEGGARGRPVAVNRTFPTEMYVRFHQTSGTRGQPLVVVDTAADWQWWIDVWQHVLDAADIQPGDRAVVASSFGPYIAWWSALDALAERSAMPIPAGGLSSLARIDLLERTGATALFCTPTYALRLVEVAAENGIDLAELAVEKIVVAGEPGGSIRAVRERIEAAFDAAVYDHAGATEVGPWGFADAPRTGLHVAETEFIAEFVELNSGTPAAEGELAELVLTTLGRTGAPVIRYRTGDLVRPTWPREGRCRFVLLEGGVLGRTDDMMIIRGVNVFPSSIEAILHGFPDVQEYRLTARRRGETDVLEIDVEDRLGEPTRISRVLQLRLGLKVEVRSVPIGTLPRFESKARRFVDERRS